MEFSTLEENQDLPGSDLEKAKIIAMIDQREIRRINNPKLQAVVDAIVDCIDVCLAVDSSRTQGFTAEPDVSDMMQWVDYVDRVMDRQIGRGTSLTDTGIVLPSYPGIGKIEPSLDSDWSQNLEHSKDLPRARHDTTNGND
jgi:hypothetical protein